MNDQTLQQIFNSEYLSRRAIDTVRESLRQLDGQAKKDFADDAFTAFEQAGAPIEVLDELYLASL